MERKEYEQIGDVMRGFIRMARMEEQMEERQAVYLWPAVVGSEIARQGPRPVVRAGVMYISIPNAGLRNELHLRRSRLCNMLNSMLEHPVIKEIKFVS
ncbi:MAG: DUF721 domain-containing protein [Muribaculaceae bacterium]|nr:DUF721 domain-containing protein [Muribaculaceae bacterium]